MENTWNPTSWQNKTRVQMPEYLDQDKLNSVKVQLKTSPAMVGLSAIKSLKDKIAKASRGEKVILQGGPCAETFTDDSMQSTYQCIFRMAENISLKSDVPVVPILRGAGQYAKPRSSDIETRNGISLPSYRGDIINGHDFTFESRQLSPSRMLQAYKKSRATLTSLGNAYVSHEALLLDYEESMIRRDEKTGIMYCASGHMLWIGDRTRQPNGAHVEFLRGVTNPIGIKCGPSLKGDELKELIEILNPKNEEGKIVLIARYGHDKVKESLPKLIKAVKEINANVTWISDPMHGNTHALSCGTKTRAFGKIEKEISDFYEVCSNEDVIPAGVHLEMTGEDVTECLGGPDNIEDLTKRYETTVDPRLNGNQSLAISDSVARLLQRRHSSDLETCGV